MAHQRALAASAGAHDDEHVAAIDGEIQIAHHDEIAICHREVLHRDMRIIVRRIGEVLGGVFVLMAMDRQVLLRAFKC